MTTAARRRRETRHRAAEPVFDAHGGVARRKDLKGVGISRDDLRTELRAGRWTSGGIHTVVAGPEITEQLGLHWRAVWESGSGAVLDGVSALIAAGLTGFTHSGIDVSVPHGNQVHIVQGVRARTRRRLSPTSVSGVPRVRPEQAAIRGAELAVSDRQATLIVCLAVQQRLVSTARLLAAWQGVRRSRRRALLDQIIRDVCDGAQSLGELDFAAACRRRGLPEPTRQRVCRVNGGRVYLDAAWDGMGLVVEIDGGHHGAALLPLDDALRQNEVTLTNKRVLRIPLTGWRLDRDVFMDQVARGLALPEAA